MPVTHEEQTQGWIRCDSAPPQTISSFLCSPCLSRACVFVCKRGVAGAQVAMWHLQGEQCRRWGCWKMLWSRRWPFAMLLQPGEYSAHPCLVKGVGGRQEESEKGPPKSELISGLRAAICMCKPVFAYASIQLCIQPLAMLKQRQACACLMDPAQSSLTEIWLLLLPNSETNHHGKYLKI